MGCSASVIKIPDITTVPPAPEVATVTILNFSQNVSSADLREWANIRIGQQKGREAGEVIVQIIGADEKQSASLNQILQKLLTLYLSRAVDTFDEETATLAQLAKRNELSVPPPLWGHKKFCSPAHNGCPSGGRFLGDRAALPPVTPGEEGRRIEQQNMIADHLSEAEMKRIEADRRVDNRARTREGGENCRQRRRRFLSLPQSSFAAKTICRRHKANTTRLLAHLRSSSAPQLCLEVTFLKSSTTT